MAEGARITIDAQLQFRHDVEANWLAADPILKVGEPAYTIGYSDRFKLGDGQSKWSELPYLQRGEGGGSQAYESLAWSAIKTLTSGDASVLAQAYAVKQAYTELKSLIPNLADYYTKEQINALIPSLEGYATESFVNTKIAELINGAPTTLDTLKEIADAFAQSQDVIEALDEAIGKKANQSDLTALAARVAANEGNITGLSNNKLNKSVWDSVFEIDAKGNLRAKVGIYSTSFISARTSDPSAGGGSGGGAFSLYTWDQVKAMTAEVGGVAPTAYALKQAYNELINATSTLSWNNISDKPIFANVATSGSYSDLIGRPTSLSDLANDVGYITSAAIPSTYAWSAISGKPTTLAGYGITDAVYGGSGDGYTSFKFNNSYIVHYGDTSDWRLTSKGWQNEYKILHSDNIGSYALKTDGSNAMGTSAYIPWATSEYAEDYSAYGDGFRILKSNVSSGNYRGGIHVGMRYGWQLTREAGSEILQVRFNTAGTSTWKAWRTIITENDSGYVGIGTTAPQYKLDVNGPIAGHEIYSFAGWMTLLGTENVSYSTYLDNKNQYGLKIHYSNGVAGAFFSQDGNTEFYGNIAIYAAYGEEKGFSVSNSKGWVSMAVAGGGGSYISTSSQLVIYTNNSQRMLINSAGNVGIGTNSPERALDVVGDIGAMGTVVANNFYGRVDNSDRVSPTEQLLVLQSEGSGMIARCPGIGFHLSGYAYSTIKMRSNGSFGFYNNLLTGYVDVQCNNITADGTIYSAVGMYSPGYITARSTAGSSDRNLKTNIAPVRNALAYILRTNYVSFDWKDTGEHSVGIIAQEELNREWSCLVQKYNEHYSYQYTQHTALIGSALQEEDKKVEAIKAEVVALKNKVQKLERQLWQQ
ncbi:MAG: tail fiber domain-containing protein [Bacteroidales bacterium]|nr:tail fiber domain-containing protein [Bacteroidales bacterium]